MRERFGLTTGSTPGAYVIADDARCTAQGRVGVADRDGPFFVGDISVPPQAYAELEVAPSPH